MQYWINKQRHLDNDFEAQLHDKELQLDAISTARLPNESWEDHERSVRAHNAMMELMNMPD